MQRKWKQDRTVSGVGSMISTPRLGRIRTRPVDSACFTASRTGASGKPVFSISSEIETNWPARTSPRNSRSRKA